MFYVYLKQDTGFEDKKLVGEYSDVKKAYEKAEAILAKDKDAKYVIEETSGYVDNYGELIPTIVYEN